MHLYPLLGTGLQLLHLGRLHPQRGMASGRLHLAINLRLGNDIGEEKIVQPRLQADRRLYRAKRNGRNRVSLAA